MLHYIHSYDVAKLNNSLISKLPLCLAIAIGCLNTKQYIIKIAVSYIILFQCITNVTRLYVINGIQ